MAANAIDLTRIPTRDLFRISGGEAGAWINFRPRKDDSANFDEQWSYVEDKNSVAMALGGNGSGKTAASALKCGRFVMSTPPPRRDTPFWIISRTYDQACGIAWVEKLWGQGFLCPELYDESQISWVDKRKKWPSTVPLKPWGNTGKNWVLHFRSYEQGWEAQQGASIGGFWLSEQFPPTIFDEVLARTRDYMFPGGQFGEFTPLDPELCLWAERMLDSPPPGYKFYRLNTEANAHNLSADWYETFFASIPKEIIATRKTGALATFQGVIYESFNVHQHVLRGPRIIPPGVFHHRGFDWGSSAEHPQAGIWLYMDSVGDMVVYDEYWSTDQRFTGTDHAKLIAAKSIAWGWPVPPEIASPTQEKTEWAKQVIGIANQLNPRYKERGGEFGQSFSGSDRPDLLRTFNQCGISTSGGTHEVLKGIEEIRRLLAINPTTGQPRLKIHESCTHLIEEMRKYRWKERMVNPMKPMEPFKPGPFKKWDDMCDALRYVAYNVLSGRGVTIDSQLHQREKSAGLQLERMGNGNATPLWKTGGAGWFRK